MNARLPRPGRAASGRRAPRCGLRALAALGLALAAHASAGPLGFATGPIEVRFDEDRAEATMNVTLVNQSGAAVDVQAIRSSCGCTVLRTPALPWRLAAGASGTFSARVDLRGRTGELHKTIQVETSAGLVAIPVRLSLPAPPISEERRRNQLLALADPRAIFRDDCRKCHVDPAAGLSGAELYRAACGICHEASPRASAVPDLRANGPQPPEHWRQWIEQGKPGSLMPPFAQALGGILDREQVESLVRFLTHPAPTAPSPAR